MSLKIIIGLSFVYLLTYAAFVFLNMERCALFLFGLSPVMVIYVAYKILKDPHTPTHNFDEKFYEDREYYRNQ